MWVKGGQNAGAVREPSLFSADPGGGHFFRARSWNILRIFIPKKGRFLKGSLPFFVGILVPLILPIFLALRR